MVNPQAHEGEGGVLTFGEIMRIMNPFVVALVGLWTTLIVITTGKLFYDGSGYAGPYLLMAFSTLIPMWIWKNQPQKGIPYMMVLVLFLGVFYLTPIVASNEALLRFSPELIPKAALAVALFFAAIGMGWKYGFSKAASEPSRWKILGEQSEEASLLAMRIGLALLLAGLVGQIIPFVINLGSFYPVARALTGLASSLGALLGGYSDGMAKRTTPIFWFLMAIIFLIIIRDVLISAAAQVILAAIIGLMLGSRKVPWKLLMITFAVISFLNLGKFIMRERYWNHRDTNNTGVTLMGLPAFYGEWILCSVGELTGTSDQSMMAIRLNDKINKNKKEGDFSDRMNSFENVLFITRQLEGNNYPLLYGATYTLIPPLLLPRFLVPNKPRSHAGQDLLNIHFGRQRAVDVERTFIAWGFLPEGMGNFGLWLGPLIVGLVIGALTGWLERWSIRKEFFSVEGFLALGLLLQDLIAYEMVASLWITSTFQMIVVCLVGGFAIRNVFAGMGPAISHSSIHD